MSRSHTYAQIPVAESHEDDEHAAGSLPVRPRSRNTANGYQPVSGEGELHELDEEEASAYMLGPLGEPSSSMRRQVDTIMAEEEAGSSSSPSSTSTRRMMPLSTDGVFSNLSAKPRVEKPVADELPPEYKYAAMDVSPAYYETTVIAPGYGDDETLVEGLPVGTLYGFAWNMLVSTSFQFVGFFLTYLLHSSHATKNGSKAGLGITCISMALQMMDQNFSLGESQDGNAYLGSDSSNSVEEYSWMSYLLIVLGTVIIVQSVYDFARTKRLEAVITATSTAAEAPTPEEAV